MDHMTRDNFDPSIVLAEMRKGEPIPNPLRLLEEGCHALARLQYEHCSFVHNVRAALEKLGE